MSAPEFVAPLEVAVSLTDGDIIVRPMSVGQLARTLTVAQPLVATLMTLPEGMVQRLEAGLPTVHDVMDLFDTLSAHPHKLIELVSIATGLSLVQTAALAADRFAYLFAVVVQVNADFFSRATPVFAAAGRVLLQVKTEASPTPATPGPLPSSS